MKVNTTEKTTLRGELALIVAVIINSFGVVLMLYSGSGISAISSVPYAFSEVFPWLTLGTWTYLFQGLLVLSLMILRKRFVPIYLFSFVVGFCFGFWWMYMRHGYQSFLRHFHLEFYTSASAIC